MEFAIFGGVKKCIHLLTTRDENYLVAAKKREKKSKYLRSICVQFSHAFVWMVAMNN